MSLLRWIGAGTVWLLAVLAVALPMERANARSSGPGPEIAIGDNVLVVPDKSARSITGWLIVKAGCADEAEGQCRGIAHYLEHLLFINRDDEHRSKVAFFPDGSGNGWTSHRATVYFQRFPSRPSSDPANLDKLIGYFAGLLSDVRVEGPQAERERNVVLQEYQQNTGRNPFARFGGELSGALLPDDPLGQRVIGTPETIRGFTPGAARSFHSRWYARNNAVIVIHGPVDPESIKALAARYIEPLPAKQIPLNVWKASRRYETMRHVLRTSAKDAKQVGVYLEKVVTYEATEPERVLMEASNHVLSAFLSSRLHESPIEVLMERDGLVTEARMAIYRIRDGALRFSFSAVPAAGAEPERVIEAAKTYLAELARTGLGAHTVDRLKLRISNERALLAEQPSHYAQALVSWLSAHYDHRSWRERDAQHQAVTLGSVNRLIAVMAGPGREVAGIMLPEAIQSETTTSARGVGSPTSMPSSSQQQSHP